MCSETSDLVPVPHIPSFRLLRNPDNLDTRRRDSGGRVGTSVPVTGHADIGGTDQHPDVGTVGVHGLAGTSHLMSAQRG